MTEQKLVEQALHLPRREARRWRHTPLEQEDLDGLPVGDPTDDDQASLDEPMLEAVWKSVCHNAPGDDRPA